MTVMFAAVNVGAALVWLPIFIVVTLRAFRYTWWAAAEADIVRFWTVPSWFARLAALWCAACCVLGFLFCYWLWGVGLSAAFRAYLYYPFYKLPTEEFDQLLFVVTLMAAVATTMARTRIGLKRLSKL